MSIRAQESPFRETAWDQRLDKMLDDLKTTVNVDNERSSSRKDLVSSFRSSSRGDSRASNRSGVVDDGLMKHEHKEYTSPDKSTKVVSDQFEYESGDPNKYTKKVIKSTYSNYNVSGDLTSGLDSLRQGPDPAVMAAASRTAEYNTDNTKGTTNSNSTNYYNTASKTSHGMTNGKPSYDDDDVEYIHEPAGGEVRKIVWRNRFEKTYETQDGTPSITIEEEARRRNKKQYDYETNTSKVTTYQPQPPPMSPGGQPWADPIPMPTPPQLSPKGEPGVAYVYTYGQGGSQVQHLPPLNYVNASVPPSEGAPSPTPSGTQPIIYHYSYHYTLQPGQTPPEGVPHHPPALQVAPGDPCPPGGTISHTGVNSSHTGVNSSHTGVNSSHTGVNSYNYKKHTTHTNTSHVDQNDVNRIINETRHTTGPGTGPRYPPVTETGPRYPPGTETGPRYPPGTETGPRYPPGTETCPRYPPGTETGPRYPPGTETGPRYPPGTGTGPRPDERYPPGCDPGVHPPEGPNRNISITINKSSHVTHSKDYPPTGPSTSTPFPTHERRSRSSSPDRYRRGGPDHTYLGNMSHVTRTSYSDSLERVRKHPNEGLPFPDTTPIKPSDQPRIPRRVDDLMTSLSDSENGSRRIVDVNGIIGPRPATEKEPFISGKVNSHNTEISINENMRKSDLKREESRNVAGPPVYYPPGHHQLFDESMHTMTLKENKRRGMAKWRMEKASGHKESSSSSESKGGMAMVPVCLPLCCGAACAIM